jgi:hypothetical protein
MIGYHYPTRDYTDNILFPYFIKIIRYKCKKNTNSIRQYRVKAGALTTRKAVRAIDYPLQAFGPGVVDGFSRNARKALRA